MMSTVEFGWHPTTVSTFIAKYADVEWHLHRMGLPVGLIERATDAEQFQITFLAYVALRLDGVASDRSRALVCTHHGVVIRLFDELSRGLGEESRVQIVLEQGFSLPGKLGKVSTVAYWSPYDLFVREHVLFD